MRARGWGQCRELQRNNSDMGGRSRCLGKEAAEGVKHCNRLWEKSRWTNKRNSDFSTAPSKKCLWDVWEMERTDIWPALDVKWGGKSRVKGFKGNSVSPKGSWSLKTSPSQLQLSWVFTLQDGVGRRDRSRDRVQSLTFGVSTAEAKDTRRQTAWVGTGPRLRSSSVWYLLLDPKGREVVESAEHAKLCFRKINLVEVYNKMDCSAEKKKRM